MDSSLAFGRYLIISHSIIKSLTMAMLAKTLQFKFLLSTVMIFKMMT